MLGTPLHCIDDGLFGSFLFPDPTENIEVVGLSGIMIISSGGRDVVDLDLAREANIGRLMEFDMLKWNDITQYPLSHIITLEKP